MQFQYALHYKINSLNKNNLNNLLTYLTNVGSCLLKIFDTIRFISKIHGDLYFWMYRSNGINPAQSLITIIGLFSYVKLLKKTNDNKLNNNAIKFQVDTLDITCSTFLSSAFIQPDI